jgi:hypothetical protein
MALRHEYDADHDHDAAGRLLHAYRDDTKEKLISQKYLAFELRKNVMLQSVLNTLT